MSPTPPAWDAAWVVLRRAGLLWAGLPPQDELSQDTAARLARALDGVRAQLLEDVPSGPYLEDDRSAAAYQLGLAPRTVAAALYELPALVSGASVLDLGAGLGAGSLAAWALGARRFTLVDAGAKALDRARRMLLDAGAQQVETQVHNLAQGVPELGRFDVVIAAFSLLEAGNEDPKNIAALATQAAAHVAPGGHLLILDSAQKDRARLINALREPLLAAGMHLWGPCPHANACPALARERDFCHAARVWHLPPDLARFGEVSGLHRHRLTYSSLLLGRTAAPAAAGNTRIIGDPHKEKGRARLAVCSGLPLTELHTLSRHKDAHRALLELERGALLAIPPTVTGTSVRVEDVSWLTVR